MPEDKENKKTALISSEDLELLENNPIGFVTKKINSNYKQTFKVKQSVDIDKLLFKLASATVLVIIVTFVFGIYLQEYSPYISSRFTALNGASKSPVKSAVNKLESQYVTANWLTYKNVKYKYTFDYPSNWVGEGLDTSSANAVVLNSHKPASYSDISGFMIKINFNSTKGYDLESWISRNNSTSDSVGGDLIKLNVGETEAYQQTIYSPVKSIRTYVLQAGQVMTITYSTNEDDRFDIGREVYDQIVESVSFFK